jgi:hypothetical protein
MKIKRHFIKAVVLIFTVAFIVTACSSDKTIELKYEFSDNEEGWSGDFSDLPADHEKDLYSLGFEYSKLPAKTGVEKNALLIGGSNASDDLFMYIKKKLTKADGIKPGAKYQIKISVEFATDAPKGAFGIGGPPGEAVFVKLGASSKEPVPVENSGYLELSADKGAQNDEGKNAVLVGNAAKNSENEGYELKKLDNFDRPITVSADDNGDLWIFVGTDSGFEGRTEIYYSSIEVTLEKVE